MKRSVLAYILIPVMAAVVIIAGSLLMRPKAKTQPKPAAVAKKRQPPAYKLEAVKGKEGKFKVAPDPKGKPLQSVLASGIVGKMLAKGVKVTIEPVGGKDKAGPAKPGTYVVSIEPAEFTSKDAVVIKVRKVEAPKKKEK